MARVNLPPHIVMMVGLHLPLKDLLKQGDAHPTHEVAQQLPRLEQHTVAEGEREHVLFPSRVWVRAAHVTF
eukprot:954897-Pelagomonas_calceolata.AAC.3